MKLNGQQIFEHMANVSDELILDSLPPVGGGAVISTRRKRPYSPMRAFFESGWFVAILCAVVSLSVVGAMVWAGRQGPKVPTVDPPLGTTPESEANTEQIRVEEETEVKVTTKKKVTVTVKDCTGKPYDIVYYLTPLPVYADGARDTFGQIYVSSDVVDVFPDDWIITPPTVEITLETQAENHLICNPDVMMGVDLTHTFVTEDEAIAYADQLVNAVVHVGYDNEHLFCNACHTDVGERTIVRGNKVTVITRDCAGKICEISYVIKENFTTSSITSSSAILTKFYQIQNVSSDAYIEWIYEGAEDVNVNFATREEAIAFGDRFKNSVIHGEYRYINRVRPTCTTAGHTDGADCASCGQIFEVPTPIPATGDHQITWNRCETCDLTVSEGLIYIPYGQNSCYVAGFAEDAPDKTQAIIPIYAPDGRPVIGVADGAFEDCENLTYVLLPKIVSYVGARSFADCPALKEVYFSGKEGQWIVDVKKADDWCDDGVNVTFSGDSVTY